MNHRTIGCVVLASGFSHRYGSNKLTEPVDGIPLYRRVLDTIPTELFHETVVVTRFDPILDYAKERHFTTVYNDHPEYGQSHSLHLGLEKTACCDATAFFVCDQPYLDRHSVEQLVELSQSNPECICRFSCRGKQGNPCIFPRKFYAELLGITGDSGGRQAICNHIQEVRTLEVSEEQLFDMDTKEDRMP